MPNTLRLRYIPAHFTTEDTYNTVVLSRYQIQKQVLMAGSHKVMKNGNNPRGIIP
ncbi:hypothetical protein KIN20_028474 [Parelaphostrongylus tenuis]|uniref:Uncharacterized protein n=1 Tax=Parelaphostrongylus tenuis TaxID=148309 RepID=A0AAD5R0U6_PARTN|nr:hypothetical protein KIN20_028474 [Parelaphostrongylus tenuis]